MSSLSAYAGRQVDIVAFRRVVPGAPRSVVLLSQELASTSDGGLLIAGVLKLAQNVLMVLLLPKGSKQYAPTQGTSFVTDALNGYWRTVADVTQSFYAAKPDVMQQITGIELTTDPADERYGDMTLSGVTLDADIVSIQITVTTLAGNSFQILTPISVPLQ
jgi:hypothetical protein